MTLAQDPEWWDETIESREDRFSESKSSSLKKLSARLKLDIAFEQSCAKHYVGETNPKHGKDRNAHTDRANRAVAEQVLDPRTMMILLKMINSGLFYELRGCISTGKEANVYHALDETGFRQFAVKIYKTTILTFKAREQYVTGEFRFRNGYCKKNPRKMVQVWAEKELRNLKRLLVAGVPCPVPILLRQQVLVMSLICTFDGMPAPRLKDAVIEDCQEIWDSLYNQTIRIMRIMYQECHLVHADFSEYNLLVVDGTKIVVIDVSQSVEHDHPMALDFLRKDCLNVISFFSQRKCQVLDLRSLFDFITDPALNFDGGVHELVHHDVKGPCSLKKETKNDACLSEICLSVCNDEVNESSIGESLLVVDLEKTCEPEDEIFSGTDVIRHRNLFGDPRVESYLREKHERSEKMKQSASLDLTLANRIEGDQQVFSRSFIPRTLDEVIDIERDISSKSADLLYLKLTGLTFSEAESEPNFLDSSLSFKVGSNTCVPEQASVLESVDTSEDEGDATDSSNDDGGEFQIEDGEPLTDDQQRALRKQHKKEVKAEKAAKRKTKIPKHVKKRKQKATSGSSSSKR